MTVDANQREPARPIQVRQESNANSFKVRVLAPLIPRYRDLRRTASVDEPLRIILDSMVLTPDRRLLFVRSSKVAATTLSHLLYRYATGASFDGDIYRARTGIVQGIRYWSESLEPCQWIQSRSQGFP